jgi:integrase
MVRHKRPKYIHAYQDRHGKERVYFNRPGMPKVPLPAPIYSEAFFLAYHKALAGQPQKPVIGASRTVAGSMNALIADYYQCAEFTGLALNTRSTYRNQLEAFRKQHGEGPVAEIKTKHIDAILGQMAKSSTSQAHKLRKRLGTLFRLAVKWEYRLDNPMLNASRVKHKTKGYEPWTEADISKFRAHWGVGTPQRIAMEILLFTGLRRSDAVRIGQQHIQADRIVAKITKSQDQVEVSIPIHPEFRAVLETITHGHMNFITTVYGAARSEKAFTNWIIEAAKAANLPAHRSPHGLRKAACIRLAEAGCTASEIMSITGHRNIAEVETYVREANKKTLADSAITKTYGAA